MSRWPTLSAAPSRGQRLVEGGAPPGGGRVAVPPAVKPLPSDQGPGEGPDPRSGARPRQQAARASPSLRRGRGEPADHLDAPGGAGQPGQDVIGGGGRARLAQADGQFGEGDQPPVSGGPLAVGVDAEPSVGLLAGQQRGLLGAGETWPRSRLPARRGRRGGSSADSGSPDSAARPRRRASADPCTAVSGCSCPLHDPA